MNELRIYVRYSGGAYNTNRIGRLSASSTSSAEAAARRMAEKVFGPALLHVDRVGEEVNCASVWCAVADSDRIAWCWSTGLIEIGEQLPAGAVQIARGAHRALAEVLGVVARHGKGKSAGLLLAPGVPEARNQQDGMTNLMLWVNRERVRNGSPSRFCVVFSTMWTAEGEPA